MLPVVHDSLLTAYAVDSQRKRLTLTLRTQHGSPSDLFKITFAGVEAHRFPFPLLPAIVLDLEEVPAADFLAHQWGAIEAGTRDNGWPGAWATSLAAAREHCAANNLKAFALDSSYGLSGWVLAQSATQAECGPDE